VIVIDAFVKHHQMGLGQRARYVTRYLSFQLKKTDPASNNKKPPKSAAFYST
jgi:hypothetical protein